MAINTITAQVPGQTSPDAEFRQAVKELKETYTRLGVKVKGKERALMGLGLPRSHSQAAEVSTPRVLGGMHGNTREVEWDEMNIG